MFRAQYDGFRRRTLVLEKNYGGAFVHFKTRVRQQK